MPDENCKPRLQKGMDVLMCDTHGRCMNECAGISQARLDTLKALKKRLEDAFNKYINRMDDEFDHLCNCDIEDEDNVCMVCDANITLEYDIKNIFAQFGVDD